MCFWRCLAAFLKIKEGPVDTARLEGAAKSLAKRCLGQKYGSHLLKKVSMDTISQAAQTMNVTLTVHHPTWQNGAVVRELRGKFGTGDQIMNVTSSRTWRDFARFGDAQSVELLSTRRQIWSGTKTMWIVHLNQRSFVRERGWKAFSLFLTRCFMVPEVVYQSRRLSGSRVTQFHPISHSSRLLWSRLGEDRGGKRQED